MADSGPPRYATQLRVPRKQRRRTRIAPRPPIVLMKQFRIQLKYSPPSPRWVNRARSAPFLTEGDGPENGGLRSIGQWNAEIKLQIRTAQSSMERQESALRVDLCRYRWFENQLASSQLD